LPTCRAGRLVVVLNIVADEQQLFWCETKFVLDCAEELSARLAMTEFRRDEHVAGDAELRQGGKYWVQPRVEVRCHADDQAGFAGSADFWPRGFDNRPVSSIGEVIPKLLEQCLSMHLPTWSIAEDFGNDVFPASPLARFVRSPAGLAVDCFLPSESSPKPPVDLGFGKPAIHAKSPRCRQIYFGDRWIGPNQRPHRVEQHAPY
jgi:hypothetical protein